MDGCVQILQLDRIWTKYHDQRTQLQWSLHNFCLIVLSQSISFTHSHKVRHAQTVLFARRYKIVLCCLAILWNTAPVWNAVQSESVECILSSAAPCACHNAYRKWSYANMQPHYRFIDIWYQWKDRGMPNSYLYHQGFTYCPYCLSHFGLLIVY